MSNVIESKTVAIVSDDVIREAVLSWLPSVDFTTITRRVCTSEMEKLYGWDLSDKKDIIKEALSEFVENETKKIMELEDSEKKKKTNSGFNKPVQLSWELAQFMKSELAPRTEVTKAIWVYIKEHKLQNPNDGREILCDDVLKTILKRPKIHMFKMTKILADQMKPVADLQETKKEKDKKKGRETKKTEKRKRNDGTDTTDAEADRKKKKSKSKSEKSKSNGDQPVSKGGFQTKMILSKELSSVLGVASESRTQVVSLMWKYIKEHELQNPNDKREILLDKKLEQVFHVKSFTMFSMNKYLKDHFIRPE